MSEQDERLAEMRQEREALRMKQDNARIATLEAENAKLAKLNAAYWAECEARRAANKAKDDWNVYLESLGIMSRRLTPAENAEYERFDRAVEQAQQAETAAMAATDAARKEAGLGGS